MSDTTFEREVGGIKLMADNRSLGGDGGPSVRVYGQVGGRAVQLLRFDCFRKDPHYHYDPEGKDDHRKLNASEVPDSVAWTLQQLRTNLPEMVRTAGYPAIADRIDSAAVVAVLPDVERAMRSGG